MIYIVDTHAWIEYFRGSNQGLPLKRLLENFKDKFITMECCLAELKGYCLKNNYDFNELYNAVKKNSFIFPVLRSHWLNAAKIRFELRKKIKNFGLIDSIVLSKQQELKCKIVRGDPHFKNLKNVVYVGKG